MNHSSGTAKDITTAEDATYNLVIEDSFYSLLLAETGYIRGGEACVGFGKYIYMGNPFPPPDPGEVLIHLSFQVEKGPSGWIAQLPDQINPDICTMTIPPGYGKTRFIAILNAQNNLFTWLARQREEMAKDAALNPEIGLESKE